MKYLGDKNVTHNIVVATLTVSNVLNNNCDQYFPFFVLRRLLRETGRTKSSLGSLETYTEERVSLSESFYCNVIK